jgi:hypothetical protein
MRLTPLLAILLPIALSCGSSSDGGTGSGSATGVVVRFKPGNTGVPAFLDVPFPTDAYLAGGKLAVPTGLDLVFKQNADVIEKQLEHLNGWSRIAPALFAVDDRSKPPNGDSGEAAGAAIDLGSLPADETACVTDTSSVFFVDLEAGTRMPCRAVVDDEREAESGRTVLGVGPARGVVLAEGHRYAAVVTNRVKDQSGNSVSASEDFANAMKSEPYAQAYDKATSLIGGGAQIVGIAPYTTQKVTSELYALRDVIGGAPPATLSWDATAMAPMGATKFAALPGGVGTLPAGFTATLDEWLGKMPADPRAHLPDGTEDGDENLPVRAHDKIDSIGTAVFEGKNWLQVKPAGYDDLDHATFARDGSGTAMQAPEKPTNKIWVTFAIPTAPMPAGGYPAVIVQHGLGGSRQYLLSLANRICSKGWIAVAIDSVTFGARAANPKYQVDKTTDYTSAPGATYAGPDGISDLVDGQRNGAFDFFGNLKNLGALRDQLRQSELDTAQLVRMLASSPDLSPLSTGAGTPRIDPTRIAYVGDSLGAIEGAAAAAIEPHLKAWTLNVGGGGLLVEIGAHGPGINSNLAIAGSINFGLRGVVFTEAHPLVTIGQAIVEAGDPIAYADKLVTNPDGPPRNIFQIEVVYDELVANEGNEALARAAGYGMALPNVGLNSGAAYLTGKPYPSGGIVLPFITDDGSGFHDTPKPGITALVAQVSPAHHGADLVRSTGGRSYTIPYNTPAGGLDPKRIQTAVDVPCPHRALQEVMVRFFGDAFDGKPPVITGLPAPKRDLDGDGKPDDQDPAPLDPNN